jgi:hypothetical protein
MFGYWAYYVKSVQPFFAWVVGGVLLFCLQLFISINERERWAPRVARTIPRRPLLRIPAFLTYSGAAGGVIFSVLGAATTLIIGHIVVHRSGSTSTSIDAIFEVVTLIGLYSVAYAMTAVLLRTWFLASAIKPVQTWVLMIVLVAIGSALPYVAGFMLHYNNWHIAKQQYWLIANPFYAPIDVNSRDVYLRFAGAWAGLAAALALPWFLRQISRFHPSHT